MRKTFERFANVCELTHFHKCSDSSAYAAVSAIKNLLVAKVEGKVSFAWLDSTFCDSLLDFLDEFQFSYRHPRRDSYFSLMNFSSLSR